MSRPRKHLGQHFLSDRRILGRIADAVGPQPGETILEIGPGPGGLTAQLVSRAERLVVIEKDRDLVPSLRATWPSIEVVEGDALEADWHALVGPGPFVVTGNIPYNITSPLIELALKPPRPRRVVFLVQKEVAERLAARPGSGEYGALTVGVQVVARVERLFGVSAGAFFPRPKVDSAVVRLIPVDPPLLPDSLAGEFRRFVVGLFGFRRKQLVRGLRELTGFSAEQVSGTLAGLELAPTLRPQELTPSDFVRLHGAIRGLLPAAPPTL